MLNFEIARKGTKKIGNNGKEKQKNGALDSHREPQTTQTQITVK